jgi:hypothetical protein
MQATSAYLVLVVFIVTTAVATLPEHCSEDRALFIGSCVPDCESKSSAGQKYQKIGDTCFFVPDGNYTSPRTSLQNRLGSCKPEHVAMFMAWVAYDNVAGHFMGKSFTDGKRMRGCGSWKVINEFHYERDGANTHAIVAVNEKSGVAIVTFRGTESSFFQERTEEAFHDWINSNFHYKKEPCSLASGCTGQVHGGFQHGYKVIARNLETQMKVLADSGYQLIFAGHSKGGSLAPLSAYAAVANAKIPSDMVSMFGFGGARVGDKQFVSHYSNFVRNTYLFRTYFKQLAGLLHETDIVSCVPLAMMGFHHVKQVKYIECNSKYIGNPEPIPNLSFKLPDVAHLIPKSAGCHYHQAYMDGLLTENISDHISFFRTDDEQ